MVGHSPANQQEKNPHQHEKVPGWVVEVSLLPPTFLARHLRGVTSTAKLQKHNSTRAGREILPNKTLQLLQSNLRSDPSTVESGPQYAQIVSLSTNAGDNKSASHRLHRSLLQTGFASDSRLQLEAGCPDRLTVNSCLNFNPSLPPSRGRDHCRVTQVRN